MKRRKCIAIATVVSQKCPLNGKRKKHARVTLEVVKKNDNLTKKRLPSHMSHLSQVLLSLCLSLANAAMQVIGVSGVDAPAAVMVGSTYLSVAKPSEAKHRNFLCLF